MNALHRLLFHDLFQRRLVADRYTQKSWTTKLLSTLLLWAIAIAAHAQFAFVTNNSGGITIKGYTGPGGDVVIPNSTNGHPVTLIVNAFNGCTTLTSVTIPDSVIQIGVFAFLNCSSLTTVAIGNGVNNINIQAFANCTSLTSVILPDSVTNIGSSAFNGCTSLTNVVIGTGVTSVASDAFGNCPNLTTLTVAVVNIPPQAFENLTGLTNLTIVNGVTNIQGSAFEGCVSLTSVTIPPSVTSIGTSAFAGCTSLTNLAIGTSVTSIGNSAFSGCASLTSVTVPTTVTNIGASAFAGCTSLSSMVIPDSVTSLGASAFYNCPSLTSMILGNGVSSIGNSTFEYCSSLTNVVIGNATTSIGTDAFQACSGLTSMTIPNSVKNIGLSAFYGCTNLASVSIGTGVTSIATGAFGAFGNCPRLTSLTIAATNIPPQAFQNLTSLTNLTIVNGVTSIQSAAFQGCSGLNSVTIPPSVTSIGTSAFASCTGLTNLTIGSGVTSIGNSALGGCGFASVTIPPSVTSIGSYAFQNCYNLRNAYFLGNMPGGDSTIFSGELGTVWYLPGATGWGSTFGGWPAGSSPSIQVQPQDQTVAAGYTMSLSAGKSNNVIVTGVQWLKGSQPIPMTTKPTFTPYGSVNFAYYNITNVQPTDAGTYSVVFSNAVGAVTSQVATVVVLPAAKFITMAGGTGGTNDGLGTAAAFNSPRHIAVDTAGNLFVTDFYNSTIRKITPAGMVSTVAGLPGVAGTNDGYGGEARFVLPHGIAVDKSGNLFVTDFGYGWNNGAIRKISPDGLVTTIAGSFTASGTNDGPGGAALFDGPMGIVVDDDESLFVSDGFNGTIRKLTPDGTNWNVSTIAGLPASFGFTDGTNSDARFGLPDGLAMDQAHNIFVADEEGRSGSGTIGKITPVGTNWVVSTIINLPSTGPSSIPSAVAVDTNGNLYVTAQGYGLIEKIVPNGTNWIAATIAGSSQSAPIVNGTGISNSFYYPHGIALDKQGNMYVVDYAANVVRKGWSSDAPTACVLNPPQISAGQVQLGVLVQTGTPTNFTLLQADQLNGPWTTNSSWLLTTNIPGLSYGVTTPADGSPFRFYRLQY